jgi:hypothetical protein
MQKKIWFVSNFQHINFAINGKYSQKNYNTLNYYVSLVIFQTYKNAILRNVHSLGWLLWLYFHLNIKYKIFLTLMLTMSPIYFLVCFNILTDVLNPHAPTSWCPLLSKKNHVQPKTLGVSIIHFLNPYYCMLSFCHFLLAFPFFCYSPSFIILSVV